MEALTAFYPIVYSDYLKDQRSVQFGQSNHLSMDKLSYFMITKIHGKINLRFKSIMEYLKSWPKARKIWGSVQ